MENTAPGALDFNALRAECALMGLQARRLLKKLPPPPPLRIGKERDASSPVRRGESRSSGEERDQLERIPALEPPRIQPRPQRFIPAPVPRSLPETHSAPARSKTPRNKRPTLLASLATSSKVESSFVPCVQALGSPTFASLQVGVQAAGAVLLACHANEHLAFQAALACVSVGRIVYTDFLVMRAVTCMKPHLRPAVDDLVHSLLRPAVPLRTCGCAALAVALVYCGGDRVSLPASVAEAVHSPEEAGLRAAVEASVRGWKSTSSFSEAADCACDAAICKAVESLEVAAAIVGWTHMLGRGKPMGTARATQTISKLIPRWRANGGASEDSVPALVAMCALDELARRATQAPPCPPLAPAQVDVAPMLRLANRFDRDAEVRACAEALARLVEVMQPPTLLPEPRLLMDACLRSALLSRARKEPPVTAALACLAHRSAQMYSDWTSASASSSSTSSSSKPLESGWKLRAEQYEDWSTLPPDALEHVARVPLPEIKTFSSSSSFSDKEASDDDVEDDEEEGEDDDEEGEDDEEEGEDDEEEGVEDEGEDV